MSDEHPRTPRATATVRKQGVPTTHCSSRPQECRAPLPWGVRVLRLSGGVPNSRRETTHRGIRPRCHWVFKPQSVSLLGVDALVLPHWCVIRINNTYEWMRLAEDLGEEGLTADGGSVPELRRQAKWEVGPRRPGVSNPLVQSGAATCCSPTRGSMGHTCAQG